MIDYKIIILTIVILLFIFLVKSCVNDNFLDFLPYPKLQSIRNPSYDLRGDPYIIPNAIIGPWMQSTIVPNPNRQMILV